MPVDGDIILKAGLNTKPVKSALDDLHKSVNKGFKNILRYGLGVRSMYALIRKLRKALTEGFGDLAQVSEPFNTAMSSIKNALAGLKSSFAAAFAPIIEFIAPALTTFINMIAKAVDAVGMLIAALTGKNEYIKAIPVQQDYAASVNKTAKSAKSASDNLDDASDSAKKLQRQLAGFDDVEILKEPKESGSGSSGSGGAGADSGIGSVQTPLSESFTSLADLLKKAWENSDFYDIGRIVGEKIRDALLNIPWTKIKETLKKVATSAATFLNGYFETPGLFSAIGITIAQAINSAFVFLYNFVSNFNWDSYGIAIRTRLTSALNNIDWGLIYETLSEFGTGIAEYLNELLTPETFESVGGTLAQALNSAVGFLNSFGDTFDFTQFGTSLARGINQFLRTFDVNRLAYGINKFIYGFRDAIIAFMSNVDWYNLGLKLRNLLVSIDWKAALVAVGKFIWEAINASISTLRGLFDTNVVEGPLSDALNGLQETLNKIGETVDFETLINGFSRLVEALSPVGLGFAAGLVDLVNTFIKAGASLLDKIGWLADHAATAIESIDPTILEMVGEAVRAIVDLMLTLSGLNLIPKLVELIDKLFGLDEQSKQINETFTTMQSTLGDVADQYDLNQDEVDGLSMALAQVANSDGPEAEQAIEALAQQMTDAGISSKDLATSLDSTLNAGVDENKTSKVKTAIKEIGNTAVTAKDGTTDLQGAFEGFNSLGFSAPLKIALLSGAINLLGEKNGWSEEKVNELQRTIDEYDESDPVNSMGKIQSAFEGVGITAQDMATSVMSSSFKLSGDLKSEYTRIAIQTKQSGKDSMLGYAEGVEDKVDDVVDAVTDVVEDGVVGTVSDHMNQHSPSRRMLSMGQDTIQGYINGIKQKENLTKTTIKNLITSIIKLVESTYTQFSTAGQQIINRIYTGMSGSVGSVTGLVYSLIASIQSSFYSMDWYSIGSNIGNGIYNGLANSANRLAVLAWNVAVNMFNSARNALGIHSPSKKFAWIGEMVSTGLGEGVEDKAGVAVAKLQTLLTTLENLGSATTIPMPDVAMGMVTPYSVSNSSKDSQSLSSVTDAVKAMHSDALTRDDIVEIVNTAMRNFTVDLYIGDEQIARHANNGNLKLSRRYGMVT